MFNNLLDDNMENVLTKINLDKAVDIINAVDNTDIQIDKTDVHVPDSTEVLNAVNDVKNHMDSINKSNNESDTDNTDSNTYDIDKQTNNVIHDANADSINSINDNVNDSIDKKIKGYRNLIPVNERAKEEQRAIQIKGGKARAEQMKRRKAAKELLETLLETKMKDDMIDDVLGGSQDLLNGDKTAYNVMLAKMFQVACAGDTKAFIAIRDTVGDKPVDKQEISADIITDADRKMIDNIKKRIEYAPID